MVARARDAEAELNLPPGFRFHPTDEELVVHYLCRKAANQHLPVPIIAELDLYKYDPWMLPDKALFGQREWYFFTPRDRKYPNGSRPNRAAGSGYWKATGADKHVVPRGCEKAAGIKKALVFYAGKAPRGVKTNWIMHEYRLAGIGGEGKGNKTGSLRLDDWVLCRLYNKKNNWQSDCPQVPQHTDRQMMQPQQQQQISQTSASIDNSSSFEEEDGSHGIGTPESDVDNNEVVYARNQPLPINHPTEQHHHQLRPIKEDNNDWFMDISLDDLNQYYAFAPGGGGFGVASAAGGGCAASNPPTIDTWPYQYQDPYFSNTGGLLSPMFTKTHHVLPPF